MKRRLHSLITKPQSKNVSVVSQMPRRWRTMSLSPVQLLERRKAGQPVVIQDQSSMMDILRQTKRLNNVDIVSYLPNYVPSILDFMDYVDSVTRSQAYRSVLQFYGIVAHARYFSSIDTIS